MLKYIIDFEFAGHVEVESMTEEDGKEIVEKMGIEELSVHIQHFNVGKHYIERMTVRSLELGHFDRGEPKRYKKKQEKNASKLLCNTLKIR